MRPTTALVTVLGLCLAGVANGQTLTLTKSPTVSSPLSLQVLPPPNITSWGITGRGRLPAYGKTGERLFIEGRDLRPDTLMVRLTLGSRTAMLQRQAGGTSARVEFVIPPDAITGELTATLQATQGGTQVLSSSFGVCDRLSVFSISPTELLLDGGSDINNEFSMQGRILQITGSCLQELRYTQNRLRNAIAIGSLSGGALIVAEERSRTFGKIELVLSTYARPSTGLESEGRTVFAAPALGPTIRVGTRPSTPPPTAAPTPAPKPLVPISISGFTAVAKWAFSSLQTPFVVVSTDPTSRLDPDPPPFFSAQIDIAGKDLTANAGTRWKIGEADLGNVFINSVSGAIRASLPANAITAPLCAIRSDNAKFCSSFSVPVVAGPRIVTVPTGWKRYGLIEHAPVDTKVRQRVTITGFDLQPQGRPDLSAELVFKTNDPSVAQACDLEPRILSFTAQRIEVSLGTPGGQRPANCSAEQEQQVSFMKPASGNSGPGHAELELKWIYQGTPVRIARWNIHGVP